MTSNSIVHRGRKYFELSKLPSSLQPAATNVYNFVSAYSDKFDWVVFKAAIDAYNGEAIKYETVISTTIRHSDINISNLVAQVAEFLANAFGVQVERSEVEAQVTGNKSNYYAVLAASKPDLTEFFDCILVTIKLDKEAASEQSFFAEVHAIQLIINKSFKVASQPKFDVFSQLPPPLVHVNDHIIEFASSNVDPETREFNWTEFKRAVDTKNGKGLTYENIRTNAIQRSDSTIPLVVDQVVSYLTAVCTAKVDKPPLEHRLRTAFNPSSNEGKAWFSSRQSGQVSEFQYRGIFGVPIEGVDDYFYSFVATATIKAEETHESGFLGLFRSTETKLSAEVKVLELIVSKTFSGF
ncbi:hypothetical protein BDP27DRAFT_1318980 [Rhodocollybia butyracea]|uniref:Uncharacterized protein n=1 Tax=Rhodocollybia butyracea TaxID=206335 RepID=A0A9P5UBJ7_9AGAR|nr:hypothetical protein BDP27DRAFT_1318980 [Rhodocollybia butyracea]